MFVIVVSLRSFIRAYIAYSTTSQLHTYCIARIRCIASFSIEETKNEHESVIIPIVKHVFPVDARVFHIWDKEQMALTTRIDINVFNTVATNFNRLHKRGLYGWLADCFGLLAGWLADWLAFFPYLIRLPYESQKRVHIICCVL